MRDWFCDSRMGGMDDALIEGVRRGRPHGVGLKGTESAD